MSDEIAEWVGIGSTPIRSDAPSGDSAKYDPLFEKLQAEIGKLEALSGGPVQWKEVIGSGREILEKKSKDLLVASYVSVGLLEQRGYAGLLAGLSCMEGMVEAFWETLYPETKRMRARINALIWLSEKGVAVGRKKPVPGEGKEVRACSEKIDALEKYFGEKLANDSPGLGDLRRAVDQWAREVESAEAATARTESPAPNVSTSAETAGPAISSGKIESIEDAERVFGEAGDVIRRAADVVRGQQPTNPWPYQVMRALTWSRFDGLPAHTDWETRIPAPPPIWWRAGACWWSKEVGRIWWIRSKRNFRKIRFGSTYSASARWPFPISDLLMPESKAPCWVRFGSCCNGFPICRDAVSPTGPPLPTMRRSSGLRKRSSPEEMALRRAPGREAPRTRGLRRRGRRPINFSDRERRRERSLFFKNESMGPRRGASGFCCSWSWPSFVWMPGIRRWPSLNSMPFNGRSIVFPWRSGSRR
ncbi:MAG: TssA family type VI secretion system protein [Candidatus Manganitrophus sp.]|nr:MAG: TssA family type VI secretion system protein [Candidatus Manganitrophus sp.]